MVTRYKYTLSKIYTFKNVAFLKTDVAKEADVEAMITLANERFGGIDVVFNNAGVGGVVGPVWDIEVAEAHVAVLFGDQLVWEVLTPIPSDPGIYDIEIEAPVDLAEGEAIHFHLHNHGSNTWNFLELSALL